MLELMKILEKSFDLILDLNINDDVQNTANRGEILGLISKAQILVSELNSRYEEMF